MVLSHQDRPIVNSGSTEMNISFDIKLTGSPRGPRSPLGPLSPAINEQQ